jgi:hypothetical protein
MNWPLIATILFFGFVALGLLLAWYGYHDT